MKSSFCIDLQRFMLIPTKFPLTLSLMKSSFCIDLQRFMLIPTKFPLTPKFPLTQDLGATDKGQL